MPVYEYRCKSCGKTHEIEHGFNDKRPTECPSCGGQLVRVFHPIGLVFKGSGFHKTDYGGTSPRASSESKPSESSSSDPKPSDSSKSGSGGDSKASSPDSGASSSSAKPKPTDPSSSKT